MLGFADQTDSNNLLSYFSKVCKGGSSADCKEGDATKGNVKKVSIGISNEQITTTVDENYKQYTLSIDPNDLLWFKKDNTLFPIVGQYVPAADLTNKYGCASTANLIV